MIYDFIVLKSGLPLISINLHPKSKICKDDKKFTLVSGFFQAITSFADSIESLGQVNELQMTDILFTFKRNIVGENEDILFILSSDKESSKSLRKLIIEEATSTFLHMFKIILNKKWNGDITPFKQFDKIFKDIVKSIRQVKKDEEKNTVIMHFNHNSNGSQNVVTQKISQPLLDSISAPIIQKKDQPVTSISKRFQRYQTLQQFQKNNQMSNINLDKNPITRKTLSIQSLIKNKLGNNHLSQINSINIQPNPENYIEHQENYFSNENINNNSINREKFLNSRDYMSLIKPKKQIFQQKSAQEPITLEHIHRTSVYDLIPTKIKITAGIFRNELKESWMKLLIVAIDNKKSVRELANILNSTPMNILHASQILVKKNLISFTR